MAERDQGKRSTDRSAVRSAERSGRASRMGLTQEAASELGILDRAGARRMADTIAHSYADGGRMVRKIIRKTEQAMDEVVDKMDRGRR